MAKKATTTSEETTPKRKRKTANAVTADISIVKEEKAKKTSKKAENDTKPSTKAVATKNEKEAITNKKNTAKTKAKASDDVVKAQPNEIIKTETKSKQKTEKTDKSKTEVPEVKAETKTKKARKVTTKAAEVVPVAEAPKKRSARKKTVEEIAPEVPILEEKKTEKDSTSDSNEVAITKPKRASKKPKIEPDSVAPALVEEKVEIVQQAIEAQSLAELTKTKAPKPKTKLPKDNASKVVATTVLPSSTTKEQKPQSIPYKNKSKNRSVINKAEAQRSAAEVIVPVAPVQPNVGTAPPLPMSKSAKRRAKKKAKKLREQQALLAQQDVKKSNVPAPIVVSVVAKVPTPQPAKPAQDKEQVSAKNKKWENKTNKPRNKFLSNAQQNVAPIYSTHEGETTTVITGKIEETVTEKTQYVSHRKLQPKPIPWADLSKLQDEKGDKKSVSAKDSTVIVPIDATKLLTSEQRREPFFQNFYRDVERFAMSEMLIGSGSKVLLAVSGGVDSVVMLDVFANLASKYNFVVYVAHYNHNLRGEASENDAKFVKSLAASYNLPFYTSTGKVLQHAERTGLSVEESARFLRYYFLERTACTLKTDFVATAHTADDSAETFLLNLFRGTGLTGLSGIPSRRQMVKDVIIIRPFLNFSKQKLKEYAERRNLEWHEDETNLQDKYTRNKIRNNLIPQLKNEYTPSITDIINRSAKLIQGADRIIHNYVRTHLPSILFDISNEAVSIKLTLFKTFDEFIRGEMLQTILMKYFKLLPLPMKIIDRIIKLEQSESGAVCEISKNILAIKDRQTLVIARKVTTNKINQKIEKKGKVALNNMTLVLKEISVEEMEFTKNPCIEHVDADLLHNTLLVRNWEHGDEFNPLGMSNTVKLSDFLINEKVSVLEKPNVLVLANSNNEIIWVCKYRISDKFKVTANTKKVLRIEIKEKQK